MTSQWKTKALSNSFLENVRGAIPSSETQIQIILKIVSMWHPDIFRVMDLGCGDGILGKFLLSRFPAIDLYCLDFSEAMLEAAKKSLADKKSVHFIQSDFSTPDWKDPLLFLGGFDLVVSGFSIHHQPDERKKAVYQEVYQLLNPEGIFLNLEHVSSATEKVEAVADDYFIDSLWDFHSKRNPAADRQSIADDYYNRPDKVENKLAPVEVQCRWLNEIGFKDVDCFFKVFQLALFGGRKI